MVKVTQTPPNNQGSISEGGSEGKFKNKTVQTSPPSSPRQKGQQEARQLDIGDFEVMNVTQKDDFTMEGVSLAEDIKNEISVNSLIKTFCNILDCTEVDFQRLTLKNTFIKDNKYDALAHRNHIGRIFKIDVSTTQKTNFFISGWPMSGRQSDFMKIWKQIPR